MSYKWQKKWILEGKETLNWAFVFVGLRAQIIYLALGLGWEHG